MRDGKPETIDDLAMMQMMVDKAKDLIAYYPKKKTNTSAEGYYGMLGRYRPVNDFRQALKALKIHGVFESVGSDKNIFDEHDPSVGFTGWGKPHADTIDYYVVNDAKWNLYKLSFKHLFPRRF